MSAIMKTIRELPVGKSTVRLVQVADGYAGVIFAPGGKTHRYEGDDPEILWKKLLAEVGRVHPDYFGFDGAKARFLTYFPKAFADPGYAEHERRYKDKAVARIAELLSLEAARLAGPDACAAAVRAIQATNLVFPVEKARIKDVLLGPTGPAFLKGAVRFADGEVAAGLGAMVEAIRPTSTPSWPMLTYLPFMWRPDAHIFLKPQVTCDYAARVGHPFARDYAEGVIPHVYESLMDLAAQTQAAIADLEPRDLIDVQSFIWVVGAYGPDEPIHGQEP